MKRIIGAALSALAFAWGGLASAADYPKMNLRMGHFLPATFAEADQDQWFAEEISRRSGGNINIEIFWAGSLGGPTELLSLVSAGAVEVVAFPVSYYPNELPLHGVVSLPRNFKDAATARETSDKLLQTDALIGEQKKNNIRPVLVHNSNPYRLACNGPVGSLDEMKGYRARSVGEYIPVMFNAVGLVPVNTPAGEVYEGLDRGTINCSMLSYDQMEASKIYEVAKYASDINLGALTTWKLWFNRDLFEGFPPEVQELILEVGKEATQRDLEAVERKIKGSVERLAEHGVSLTPLSDMGTFNTEIPLALDLWTAKMEKLGMNAEAAELRAIMEPVQAGFE